MCSVIGLLSIMAAAATPAELVVDLREPARTASPMLYGIFFEDINHAADGGLYAELVRNRSFEDMVPPERCTAKKGEFHTPNGWKLKFDDSDPIPGWKVLGGNTAMALDQQALLNKAQTCALRISVSKAGAEHRGGVLNEGFWGVPVRQGARYVLSLYAKSDGAFSGPLEAAIEDADGHVYASGTVSDIGGDWKRFETVLTGTGNVSQGRLVLASGRPCALWLDCVSLMPASSVYGLRDDLFQMLTEMKPAFVRFPGGCFVEGFTYETALRWKNTIGPVEARKGHWNLWGYRGTDGLGYHELLRMCEDIGAAPLLVVNCGMTCQGRHPEIVPLDQIDEWIQDALDAIEYANGETTSVWGAVRAAAGHPAPFNLRYMEIGNENSGPLYDERYKRFRDAIKARYPEMKLIANCPVANAPMDIVDDHYYNSPDFFLSETRHYDGHDRNGPQIYVGEYAVTQECGKGNLRAAVAEAAFLTGLERNSDVVCMSSYAPLFVNVHDRCWNPDAIVFDNVRAYGTPSYYVNKMFSETRGDEILSVALHSEVLETKLAGGVGLATWETQAEFKELRVMQGGKVLLASDFQNADGWRVVKGDWKAEDGVYRQSSEVPDARAMIGDPDWKDYTVTVKARKLAGKEGFFVMFAAKDDANWIWLNIGGWGNRFNGIEACRGGAKSPVGTRPDFQIETGRWYDVRVEVQGCRIRTYLDGQLLHDISMPALTFMAAAATRDSKSGHIILKVANGADEPQETSVRIEGNVHIAAEGRETILTSAHGDDENSFDAPTKVVPVTTTRQGLGPAFTHTFPPQSVTILELDGK